MDTYFYVVLAFLVGVLVGWFIWGRLRGELDSLRGDLGRTRGERDKLQAASERLTGELDASGKARADLERRLNETTPAAVSGAAKPEGQAPAALLATPAKVKSTSARDVRAKPAVAKAAPAKAASARVPNVPAAKASAAKASVAKASVAKVPVAKAPAAKSATPTSAASNPPASTAESTSGPLKKSPVTPKSAARKAAPTAKAPAAKPDILRRLIGIGPVNEKLLMAQGVTSFAQIAAWTAADIKRIEDVMNFDGRIARERWIEQARLLAAGDETAFAKQFPTAGTTNNS
ncbi:proton-conducting membrane transporter [Mesorhizobium sp. ES1-1]|uniref:proton-conducting membrane transporter n=1 Tax=Mesorhizobium sp. ES1-1 TaxID=2876629 RepID=UPI001CCE9948|nr:proton-conducting membrane transporter [Mesorhizobium sp. ES1-1]MBZ9677541.1 proton-conducting membrane transporter [Mesorhizobium sp. ES1-1]